MTDALTVTNLLQTLIGIGVAASIKVLTDVRRELRMLNGRLGRMEQWRSDHDKQDDERHTTLLARLGR